MDLLSQPIPASSGVLPKVLVLTPMRNAAANLKQHIDLLLRLDYPPALLSLGILEGDSDDQTFELLQAALPQLNARFTKVVLVQHHHGVRFSEPRWMPHLQRQRRALIAQARNRLLSAALDGEDWVLWLDSDLLFYPPHLLRALLAAGKDIVVPYCRKPDGSIFDMNTFRFDGDRQIAEDPRFMLDGIFQPPSSVGRRYLTECQESTLIEVHAVGGTALLVNADLHRDGLIFPAWPHRGYIETEGLAAIAQDLGIACWGMPQLDIIHVNA